MVCHIRKPACAGSGCTIFPVFQTTDWGQKIRCPAGDDLFRVSLGTFRQSGGAILPQKRYKEELIWSVFDSDMGSL